MSAENSFDRTVPEWLRRIQIEWSLTFDQIAALMRVDRAFLESWIGPGAENRDFTGTIPPGLETAAPLIAIYRKLAARYPNSEDQVKWLFTDHQEFGGSKPIDVATSSLENLYWVGYFLDSSPA